MATRASQGRWVPRKEAQPTIVAPTTWCGETTLKKMVRRSTMQEGSEQGTQHICSFGCNRHRWQFSVEPPPCKYASQLGRQMTHPTSMNLVDHFLAPVHGWGIHQQQTPVTHLCPPYASTTLPNMVQLSLRGHQCPILNLRTIVVVDVKVSIQLWATLGWLFVFPLPMSLKLVLLLGLCGKQLFVWLLVSPFWNTILLLVFLVTKWLKGLCSCGGAVFLPIPGSLLW